MNTNSVHFVLVMNEEVIESAMHPNSNDNK